MSNVTTKPSRLTEAQTRAVACPECGAPVRKPCRGSRIPGPNTFGGGWGGPPDLGRAHDARRKAALEDAALRTRAAAVIEMLLAAETDAENEPDMRQVLGVERQRLHAALQRRDAPRIEAYIEECLRVAKLWGVEPTKPAAMTVTPPRGPALPLSIIFGKPSPSEEPVIWLVDGVKYVCERERGVCRVCTRRAVVAMPEPIRKIQPDGTTHVCVPHLGGCNHGYADTRPLAEQTKAKIATKTAVAS